jgi:hypothetical protein
MTTVTSPLTDQARGPARSRGKSSYAVYWIAVFAAAVGFIAGCAWAVSGTLQAYERPADFARTTIPGAVAVDVKDSKAVMLYFEGSRDTLTPSMSFEVKDPEGRVLPVAGYGLDLRYDYAGQVGRAVASFRAAAPGTYQVAVSGVAGDSARLAIGDSLGKEFVHRTWMPLVLIGISILLGLGFGIAALVSRSRFA